MKKKPIYIIFGLIITCGIFLLFAGCTNKNIQKNAVPGSTDKAASSTDSAAKEGDGINGPIYTPAENMLPGYTALDKDFIYAAEVKKTKDTLTLLDHTNIDLDKDGQEETIELYTAAEKDSKGEIAWDDGQRWLLTVVDSNAEFVLFDNYVQLGELNYWLYTSEENTLHITTIQNCDAEFIVSDYIFDSHNKRFEKNVLVNPPSVNMLHHSHY